MSRRQRHNRQRPQTPAPRSDDLSRALDALNAWGYLEDCIASEPPTLNCFGPGVFRGLLPQTWAGVCIWYKQRGYRHYQTLGLLGIWALRGDEAITVTLGTKTLIYRHPIFNAEGYYFRIRQEFRTFYHDDGSPPAQRSYTTVYDPARRLEIRRALESALADWRRGQQQAESH